MSVIGESVDIIQEKFGGLEPKVAVFLGSGLGRVAKLVNPVVTIDYKDLPGFPVPSVGGHSGQLVMGTLGELPVIFMKGRQHYYEGQGFEATKTMIRSLKAAGVETLVLTNAAGSLRHKFNVGSLVAISDHIMLTGINPLIGKNEVFARTGEPWGGRFVPQPAAWDKALRAQLLAQAGDAGVTDIGEGVYMFMTGPTFETPAEIRAIRRLGADTVGMSTVIENIIARHCGMKCVGVSAVTNLAEGLTDVPLGHEQTLAGAEKAAKNMEKALGGFLRSLAP